MRREVMGKETSTSFRLATQVHTGLTRVRILQLVWIKPVLITY
jgi:hypothetical protein